MEVRPHPFLTSLLHGSVVSLALQAHHQREKRPWYALYRRLHGTRCVHGDKEISHFLLPQIKYWWPRTQPVTLPMELSTSNTEIRIFILDCHVLRNGFMQLSYTFTCPRILLMFSGLGIGVLWPIFSNPSWPWDPERRKTGLVAALCWLTASESLSVLYKLLWLRETDTRFPLME